MVVDHRGDGSQERHPSRHVEVQVAGFCHPVTQDREKIRKRVCMWTAQVQQHRSCAYCSAHSRASDNHGLGAHMMVALPSSLYPKHSVHLNPLSTDKQGQCGQALL